MQVSTFQEVSAREKKNICLYPETAPRNKPKCIEESLRGDELVKNFSRKILNE